MAEFVDTKKHVNCNKMYIFSLTKTVQIFTKMHKLLQYVHIDNYEEDQKMIIN